MGFVIFYFLIFLSCLSPEANTQSDGTLIRRWKKARGSDLRDFRCGHADWESARHDWAPSRQNAGSGWTAWKKRSLFSRGL